MKIRKLLAATVLAVGMGGAAHAQTCVFHSGGTASYYGTTTLQLVGNDTAMNGSISFAGNGYPTTGTGQPLDSNCTIECSWNSGNVQSGGVQACTWHNGGVGQIRTCPDGQPGKPLYGSTLYIFNQPIQGLLQEEDFELLDTESDGASCAFVSYFNGPIYEYQINSNTGDWMGTSSAFFSAGY